MLAKRVLLIDDLRVRAEATDTVRSYIDGITALRDNGPWDLLLLDHDLASFDTEGNEWTGYDIMCWLEENPKFLPGSIEFVTSNPVGRAKMEVVRKRLYGEE